MNTLISKAKILPIGTANLAISVAPIVFNVAGRPAPLELRVTAPLTGTGLPVALLSHGGGPSNYIPSRDGYGPLVNFLGEHGFVVIQTSHQNSRVAGFAASGASDPIIWKSRAQDLSAMIDHLDEIEETVPTLKGRLDKSKIAAIGHSFGGHTVGTLLGSRISDLKDRSIKDVELKDTRIKVGVLIAPPGKADGLSASAQDKFPFLGADFSHMSTTALVINGEFDHYQSLNERGPSWHEEAYHDSPGKKSLLTVRGGKHGFGGIAGYDAKETDDEDPDRLEMVRRMIWSYLRTALGLDEGSWSKSCQILKEEADSLAFVQEK